MKRRRAGFALEKFAHDHQTPRVRERLEERFRLSGILSKHLILSRVAF